MEKALPKSWNRHVGDGVDLHRHGEGGHDRVPKLFTRPWTMRMPKFITDCCRQVKKGEIQQVFSRRPGPNTGGVLDPQSGEGKPGVEKQAQAGDELGDHRGHGGPRTPMPKGHHKEDVRPMFRTTEIPKKTSGVAESPTERREDWQKKLYRKVATMPAKIHCRYSFVRPKISGGICRRPQNPVQAR